eukprot:SAG31_NODE_23091_length_511_cov_1.912621_1_plen_23_part_10
MIDNVYTATPQNQLDPTKWNRRP